MRRVLWCGDGRRIAAAVRDEELARSLVESIRRRAPPHSAPLLCGVDASTYALDLDVAGEHRELVLRVFTMPEQSDGAGRAAVLNAISGIPANAPILIPRTVLLDAEASFSVSHAW